MKKNILLIIIFFGSLTLKGQVFFTEDFASGIPVGWTNVDNSGNNVLWRTTTTGSVNTAVSVDTALNPVGTSAANGYLIIDSDSAGQIVTEDAVLTTSPINCTGHASVHLVFNEYFAQYLASSGTVSISNDNLNWVDVHSSDFGLLINQGTPNANHVEIDVTSTAANQATVYIRFSYHGEWDYWWFVDDVQLLEPPAVDLAVTSIEKLNTEYTMIPYVQAADLNLSAEVTNTGGSATTGGTALFEIYNGLSQVFSENINLPSIATGATQTIAPVGIFTPTSAGSYTSKLTVTIAGDGNTSNDIMESDPITLSDTIYARDDDNFAGTLGVGVGAGEDAITGQNFRVNTIDNLSSITFFMDEGFGAQPAGTPVFFTVHSQADTSTGPDGSNVLAYSDTILFTPGMIPAGGAYYTVSIHGGFVQLSPGLYFIGIHETDSILTIGYSNSIYTPGAVWVHWNTIPSPPAVNGWAHAEDFTIVIAYMIRANFGDGSVSVNEANAPGQFSVFPNPATEKIFLRGHDFPAGNNYKVNVMNIFGQEVFTCKWNGTSDLTVDVSKMPAGIYTVSVKSEEINLSRKIAVNR
jgi:hypothetical protein